MAGAKRRHSFTALRANRLRTSAKRSAALVTATEHFFKRDHFDGKRNGLFVEFSLMKVEANKRKQDKTISLSREPNS